MDNNCYWDASGKEIIFSGKSLTEWQALGHDKNSIIADPGFADIVGRDFTLADDSPALALGFTPIDVSASGLYGDAAWTDRAKQLKRIPAPPVAN